MKKTVKVVKNLVQVYEVESNSEDFSHEGALAIVQARMKAGMPLGLTKDEETIVHFDVDGTLYGPDGTLLAKATKTKEK